ncbi:MAG: hypothetical protein KDJ35_08955 [Alphaproteobacteria bacterium]|nr:hypothetical protein [Alphaproteobacteria bacterium]
MSTKVTYTDLYNGIFRPLEPVIAQMEKAESYNLERVKQFRALKPQIFTNGHLTSSDTLNPDYADQALADGQLKIAFAEANLNVQHLITLFSYYNILSQKAPEEIRGMKVEALPHLRNIIAAFIPPQEQENLGSFPAWRQSPEPSEHETPQPANPA